MWCSNKVNMEKYCSSVKFNKRHCSIALKGLLHSLFGSLLQGELFCSKFIASAFLLERKNVFAAVFMNWMALVIPAHGSTAQHKNSV